MTLYDTFALRSSRRGVATDVPVVLAGSLLLVLSAKFQVPFFPVPMSMQTFVAIGLGLALGPVRGALAVALYLAQGAAGWLAGRGFDRNPATAMAAALLAGAIIYVPGLLWLGAVIGWDKPVLALGLYPFIPGDIAKAMLAAIVFPAAWKWLSARGLD